MIHSVASWEKNAVAKSTSEQCEAPAVQESLCDCPEHEIIAHRRQSVAQRRLSTKVWEGRVPLVFPLFAMVILSIGFALMLFACHQGTMAGLGCTLESFAGRTEEPCWSMLQKKRAVRIAAAFHGQTSIQGHAHHLPQILPPPPRAANPRQSITLAVYKTANQLALNSQRCACLYLPSAGCALSATTDSFRGWNKEVSSLTSLPDSMHIIWKLAIGSLPLTPLPEEVVRPTVYRQVRGRSWLLLTFLFPMSAPVIS